MNRNLKKMLKGKKLIGIGSTRLVFDLSNGNVLKLAVSNKGFQCNITEARIYSYASPEIRKHLGRIKKYHFKYRWLVMKKYKLNLRETRINKRRLNKLKVTFRKNGIIAKDIISESGKINRGNSSLINKNQVVIIDYGKFELVEDLINRMK
jgi:hypothetical protein